MIATRGLSRTFKANGQIVEAVRGLDLEVHAGELVAFLGPNGAGKSTSLRMLTTLLRPTAGSAVVAGHDVLRNPSGVRSRIGYIGQGNGAGHLHRAMDELVTQGRAYGMSGRAALARASELLESLGLEGLGNRLVSSLSGGQRRRLDIAMGLMHRPDLLFLDEPSTGLDPQNRVNLAEHIRRLRAEQQTTIFFTTHYMDEADQLAERVIVIDHGQVIADDTPEALKAELAGDLITLTVKPAEARRTAELATMAIGPRDIDVAHGTIRLRVADGPTLLPALLRALDHANIAVHAAEVQRPTLDDVFLALTGHSLREGASD
ncbi:MAG TPA: ATP-binding cassette domain-containing protein [Chloroflexota bacterium]|nr:ATP-binding cassette domain-containing protein [Chloroflexota bacterium]